VRASSNATRLVCRNACISDDEEGGAEDDDDDDDDAVTDTAADDAAPDDDNNANMPPKLKAPPRKPAGAKKTKGDSAAAAESPAPPNFSVDSTDKFLVAYHTKGKHDVADVMFHVNGVLRDTDYRVSVAADRQSVSWQRAIHSICFTKKILQAILKNGYSASSHRTVAYDDVTQEMQDKKMRPEHKLFWGAPQVVRLKWECTGATAIFKRDYPIEYVIVDSKRRKNRQCNSVLIVQVKRAKERAETEAEVDTGQISLFGAFSQGSNASDGPPSPPPRRKSPRHNTPPPAAAAGGHRVDEDDDDDSGGSEFPDEDDSGDQDDDGGGGGRGSDGGGKRKRTC
jgi:hypothetical protein